MRVVSIAVPSCSSVDVTVESRTSSYVVDVDAAPVLIVGSLVDVGETDGSLVGPLLGPMEGRFDGSCVGEADGCIVGCIEGD